MATAKIQGASKAEMFVVEPDAIVVDTTKNGRWAPHDDSAIDALVASFESVGQLQPIVVRKTGNKFELLAGFRRYAAAIKFNEKNTSKMLLKAVVVSANDEEAFLRNIIENKERREPSPMDDAHNQRRLRELFNWEPKRIAQFYGVTQSYVSQLKRLLKLAPEIQAKVHSHELSYQAALQLSDLPETDQKEIVAKVAPVEIDDKPANEPSPATPEEQASAETAKPEKKAKGKKIKTSDVVEEVRKKKGDKGDATVSRTAAEMREFCEGLVKEDEESIQKIGKALLDYMNGKVAAMEALQEIQGVVK